jgi:hypothetical protein
MGDERGGRRGGKEQAGPNDQARVSRHHGDATQRVLGLDRHCM